MFNVRQLLAFVKHVASKQGKIVKFRYIFIIFFE